MMDEEMKKRLKERKAERKAQRAKEEKTRFNSASDAQDYSGYKPTESVQTPEQVIRQKRFDESYRHMRPLQQDLEKAFENFRYGKLSSIFMPCDYAFGGQLDKHGVDIGTYRLQSNTDAERKREKEQLDQKFSHLCMYFFELGRNKAVIMSYDPDEKKYLYFDLDRYEAVTDRKFIEGSFDGESYNDSVAIAWRYRSKIDPNKVDKYTTPAELIYKFREDILTALEQTPKEILKFVPKELSRNGVLKKIGGLFAAAAIAGTLLYNCSGDAKAEPFEGAPVQPTEYNRTIEP